MLAVKTVCQPYVPSSDAVWLLEQFRRMLNDCIRIGVDGSVTSLKSLSLRAYKQLSGYDAMSYYKLCAISRAAGILRNYRKARRRGKGVREPYAWRPQLVTCYGFKVVDGKLLLPLKPRQSIEIPLNRHTIDVLSQPGITVRSVTLTASTVGLAFSKEVALAEPTGLTGVDSNLDNVTIAGSGGSVRRYDLSEASRIKETYRQVKAGFTRHDARMRRKIFQKYGCKQWNRVRQIIHLVSKQIVEEAKADRQGIVMERLTGIRKLYRKGNRQGSHHRGRMNSWSFRELQRQIEYKAAWEGLPVTYVPPAGTSAKCSMCGRRLSPEEGRMLRCSVHGVVDRDANAAKNIRTRGLRLGPIAPRGEAMQACLQAAQSIAVSQV